MANIKYHSQRKSTKYESGPAKQKGHCLVPEEGKIQDEPLRTVF